jgi:putative addiction module component (TIGR02574 family)
LALVLNLGVARNCYRVKALINGGDPVAKSLEQLAAEIHGLPDTDKLQLVDTILQDLDKPDPEIDRVWADEARKRWQAYKSGHVPTVNYAHVMAKHRRS